MKEETDISKSQGHALLLGKKEQDFHASFKNKETKLFTLKN